MKRLLFAIYGITLIKVNCLLKIEPAGISVLCNSHNLLVFWPTTFILQLWVSLPLSCNDYHVSPLVSYSCLFILGEGFNPLFGSKFFEHVLRAVVEQQLFIRDHLGWNSDLVKYPRRQNCWVMHPSGYCRIIDRRELIAIRITYLGTTVVALTILRAHAPARLHLCCPGLVRVGTTA